MQPNLLDLEQRVSNLEGQMLQVTQRVNQREPLRSQLLVGIIIAIVAAIFGVVGALVVFSGLRVEKNGSQRPRLWRYFSNPRTGMSFWP